MDEALKRIVHDINTGWYLDNGGEERAVADVQQEIAKARAEGNVAALLQLGDGDYETHLGVRTTVGRDKLGNKTVKMMVPYATEQYLIASGQAIKEHKEAK